jgi:hypothetical protein
MKICVTCGYLGNVKKIPKGSLGAEIVLWLFFIFPGIIYSLWRQSTYAEACPQCKSQNVVPPTSPIGRQMIIKHHGGQQTLTRVMQQEKAEGKKLLLQLGIGAAIFIGILLYARFSSAEIYKWRDADGKLHFSDKPVSTEAQTVGVFDSKTEAVKAAEPAKPAQKPSGQRSAPDKTAKKPSDYKINPQLKQRDGWLHLSGRVEGGEECANLTVDVSATSDEGSYDSLTAVVRNVGGFKSGLMDAKTSRYNGNNNTRWTVTSVYSRCAGY